VRQPLICGVWIGSAVALLAAQPARATATQITGIRLNQAENNLELTLETQGGETSPEVLTLSQENEIVADIPNATLKLEKEESFHSDNPLPGIESVLVSQDINSVRVTVRGASSAPTVEVQPQDNQTISLSFGTAPENEKSGATPEIAITPTPSASSPSVPKPDFLATPKKDQLNPTAESRFPATPTETPAQIAQVPNLPSAPGTQLDPSAQATPTPQPVFPAPTPDVLVPNPEIIIQGAPAAPAGVVQPVAPAPPFLPRAVAPPVGDIAISTINPSPTVIDLGTGARVPRLVLREAPIREVLALLARSAGLNLAFSGAAGGAEGAAPGAAEQTISLDLENEAVQDVFNFVLQLSGFQANRVGRTIFVGSQLPLEARNLVARTLRLNQVTVSQAVGFLIAQGAEQQQISTQTTLTVVGEGAAAQRITNTTTSVQRIAPTVEVAAAGAGAAVTGPLVLRGLAVTPDERLNAITLIGEPRKIEIASALLTQLDLRRRQVAVNVKIVDINLLGTDAFNSSFSFGLGDGFFAVDGGAAAFNYGGFSPPTAGQLAASPVFPTVVTNPFAGADVFLDPDNPITVPGTTPGTVRIDQGGNPPISSSPPGSGTFPRPFIRLDNPLLPGFTDITPPTNDIITITPGTAGQPPTVSVTQGQPATLTSALPALLQTPSRFLASLQAQITSGNAKILTDPTLVVQEGETATVNLTQEVFGGFEQNTVTENDVTTTVQEPIIKEAGLILEINVNRIDDNGFISLFVNPTVSAPASSIQTPQGLITLVQSRDLQSGQIRIRDGQTLILSGIIQESDQTTVTKVPILGDIPILGALFRSTNRTNQRNEVIVLLTPQILDDSAGSAFGYNYVPGSDARRVLQQQGFPVQGN
jgi:type IV pilus assembly protein PilQ